jgi:glutathione S-transferase
MIEHPDFSAAGKGLVESTAIMQFLCNNWGKDALYPPVSEAGRRAVVDRSDSNDSSLSCCASIN